MRKRHSSIKTRLSLWYAALIVVIMFAVASIILNVGNNTIAKNATAGLTDAVDMAVDNISISDGKLTIDPDFPYRSRGADIAIYSDSGLDISGLLPEDFDENTAFVDDEMRIVGEMNHRYFVYDRLVEYPGSYNLWIRGVMSAELRDIAPDFLMVIEQSLIIFPILFIIALIGGLVLTYKAFVPLKKITDTAEEISNSGDLSRRIGTGDRESPDEVIRAAGVFDEMLEKLEHSFEDQKRFTNDASHELRTPTAVIMAESEYALENKEDTSEMISSLETIHKESKNLNTLVQQLLTLARADQRTLKLNKEKTDISLLAEERCEMARHLAKEKGITVEADCEEGVYMDVDPVLFGRIYGNLLSNSIKYGKQGGKICVRVRSNDTSEDGQKKIHISVSDDGIGISEEALPHVFDRFYREDRTSEKESTGLGLSIVKWIVDAHGGKITCSSIKGSGTVFDVWF